MCTVVFLPGSDAACFVSLRDEDPARALALPPRRYTEEACNYMAPLDPLAGGTWLGANEYGNVIILLNGGFTAHQKKEQYVCSRGRIVTRLLATELPVIEWLMMDLNGVEPFTLVVWSQHQLFQLVWDGEQKHRSGCDSTRPHIWSSSTLYDKDAREKRSFLFRQWLASVAVPNTGNLMDLFRSQEDTRNGFLIDRDGKVKTLSSTCIELYSRQAIFRYEELGSGKKDQSVLPLLLPQSCLCNLENSG